MSINDFVKSMLKEHNLNFNLLVLENENIYIYDKKFNGLIIAQSDNLKYQLVDIIDIVEYKEEVMCKIKLPNNAEGYFTPKNSVFIIPKKVTQVKISKDAEFQNHLNSYMNLDKEYFDNNIERVLYSKYYAVSQGVVYECLILVDEIIGFIEPGSIHILHRHEQEFKIINDTTTYRDSALTKSVSVLKNQNKIFRSQYIIIEENKVRIKNGSKILWISLKDTNLIPNIINTYSIDINEILIESLLAQYKDKLQNYHKYYNKLLNRNKGD